MDNLKKMIHQRGQVKARVTTIVGKLTEAVDFPEAVSLSQLKAFERKLELHYAEYSAKHDQIMVLCPTEIVEAQDKKLDEFDELHTDALVKLNQLMEFFRAEPANNRAPQVIVTQQPLSTPIPTFDGSYEGWPKFKALFNDLVGKCGDSDATKLQYLDKALVGGASGILDAKIINNNSYDQAWQLLEERFENPRVIIDSHISGLLTMKPIFKQSCKELRSLIDTCNRHVEGLRYMKQEVDGTAGLIVVKLLTMCLDGETRKQWELTLDHGELPDLDDSLKFLRNYCQVLERCEIDKVPSIKPSAMTMSNSSPRASYPAATSSNENVCQICAGQHSNHRCPLFLSMSVDQRVSKAKQSGLCFNCLRKGHQIRECPSEKSCTRCSKRHHSMLHFEQVFQSEPNQQSSGVAFEQSEVETAEASDALEEPVSTACSSVVRRSKHVFLMTALVNVTSNSGRDYKLRALLDSGSQINLLSESAVKLLGLPRHSARVPVVGVGGVKSQIRHRVNLKISSDYAEFERVLDCLVTKRVTGGIPSIPVSISNWKIPTGIVLADPEFNEPRDVDMLIGAELFPQILRQAQLRLSNELPTLFETQFGWIVTGAFEESGEEAVHVMCATYGSPLRKRFQRCSEQKLPERKVSISEETVNQPCNTSYRDGIGRAVIPLWCDESIDQLEDYETLVTTGLLPCEKVQASQSIIKESCQVFIRGIEDVNLEFSERNDVVSRPTNFPSQDVQEFASFGADVDDSVVKSSERSDNEIMVIESRGGLIQPRGELIEDSGGDTIASGALLNQEHDQLRTFPESKQLFKRVNSKTTRLGPYRVIAFDSSTSLQPWTDEASWTGAFEAEQLNGYPVWLSEMYEHLWFYGQVVLAWIKRSSDPLQKGGCVVKIDKLASVYRGNSRQCQKQDVEESVFCQWEECNSCRREFKRYVRSGKGHCQVICCSEGLWTDYSSSLHRTGKLDNKCETGTIVLLIRDSLMKRVWRLVLAVALHQRQNVIRAINKEMKGSANGCPMLHPEIGTVSYHREQTAACFFFWNGIPTGGSMYAPSACK